MKIWEVLKGMDEKMFAKGDKFEITFPDGQVEQAIIGTASCLWFLRNGNEIQTVYFGTENKSIWRLITEDEKLN